MTQYNKALYQKRKGPVLRKKKRDWKREKSRKEHEPIGSLLLGPYKEPLKKVTDGYGYVGALTFDIRGKLQCHICGGMYDHLAFHVKQHDLSVPQYKEKFELSTTTALISEGMRERYKMEAYKKFMQMNPAERRERMRKSKKGWEQWYANGGKEKMNGTRLSLETKNKRGICPDQLIKLIRDCADHLDRQPSYWEFQNHYKTQRFAAPIRRTFGSWNNAIKAAGFTPQTKRGSPKGKEVHKHYTKESLLELLNGFYQEYNIVPTSSDCRRGFLPDAHVFIRRFGSFGEARRLAGLPDVKRGGDTTQKKWLTNQS